jgi:hypothetical protein
MMTTKPSLTALRQKLDQYHIRLERLSKTLEKQKKLNQYLETKLAITKLTNTRYWQIERYLERFGDGEIIT